MFENLARLLPRWQARMKNCHAVWHVGKQTTLTHIVSMARNLANYHALCESVNVTMKIKINFYDMTTVRYILIKEKFEQMCGVGPYFV